MYQISISSHKPNKPAAQNYSISLDKFHPAGFFTPNPAPKTAYPMNNPPPNIEFFKKIWYTNNKMRRLYADVSSGAVS